MRNNKETASLDIDSRSWRLFRNDWESSMWTSTWQTNYWPDTLHSSDIGDENVDYIGTVHQFGPRRPI